MALRLVCRSVCLLWLFAAVGGASADESRAAGVPPPAEGAAAGGPTAGGASAAASSASCVEATTELKICKAQLEGAERLSQASASELSQLRSLHEQEMDKCGVSHAQHAQQISECERDKALLAAHMEEAQRQQQEFQTMLHDVQSKNAETQQRQVAAYEERLGKAVAETHSLRSEVEDLERRLAAAQAESAQVKGDTIKKLAAFGADVVTLYTATAELAVESIPEGLREAAKAQAVAAREALAASWGSVSVYFDPYVGQVKRLYEEHVSDHLAAAASVAGAAMRWSWQTAQASAEKAEPVLNAALDGALESVFERKPALKGLVPASLWERVMLVGILALGTVLCGILCKRSLHFFCAACRALRRRRVVGGAKKKKFVPDGCTKDEKGVFGIPSPKRMPIRPANFERNEAFSSSYLAPNAAEREGERDGERGERRRLHRLG